MPSPMDHDPVAPYRFTDATRSYSSVSLRPALEKILGAQATRSSKAIDIGCGNGCTSAVLHELGYDVLGVDPSSSGIEQARRSFPHLTFHVASGYDDLAAQFGSFPLVTCFEVIEHCYWPHKLVHTLFDLLEPGGTVIISTPYHGYFKNVALALANRMDRHWAPLSEGGHIKFWSVKTFTRLLQQAGFKDITFHYVGRVRPLAKSMVAVMTK